MLAAKPSNIKTGQPITEEDLTKDEYTGKDFDDELFIDMRTPAMCADLFKLLCENGGPEQKVIIFCTREIHADRVAMQMNAARYDFSQGVRGKYAQRYARGSNVVVLEPDVAKVFPNADVVNSSLRSLAKIIRHRKSLAEK